MQSTSVGVDLARTVFEIAVSEQPGKVSRRLRRRRDGFLSFFAQLPPATVVMEAFGSAHFWVREIQKLGDEVVLLPPQHVRPYVLRNRTDSTDATGPRGRPDVPPGPARWMSSPAPSATGG
jgi:transposase